MLDSEKARKIRSVVREKSIRRNVSNNSIKTERSKSECMSEDIQAPNPSNSIGEKSVYRSSSIEKILKNNDYEVIISQQTTIAIAKLSGPTISNIKALTSVDEKSEFSGDGVSSLAIVGEEDYYSVSENSNFQKSFLHSVGNSIAEENDDILPRSPTFLNVRSDSSPLTLKKAVERNKLVVIKHQQQT